MTPKKLRVPAMFHHKASDQDAVCIRNERGKRRTIYLGKRGSAAAQRRVTCIRWGTNITREGSLSKIIPFTNATGSGRD